MAKTEKNERIEIIEMRKGVVRFCVLGVTPLVCEAVSLKAKQELLLPKRKKTRSERATTLKHHPRNEFQASVYQLPETDGPTFLAANGMWFKAAMTSAAIDLPGATKAELGRLAIVRGDLLPLYGIPKMMITPVRLGDMARTMDVRVRAVIPEWACLVSIEFVTPQLNERAVTNLMAWAGTIRGVGGWRVQKGGIYGQFQLVKPDHPDYVRIMETQGREAQASGMDDAAPYDLETRRLLEYFDDESGARELVAV